MTYNRSRSVPAPVEGLPSFFALERGTHPKVVFHAHGHPAARRDGSAPRLHVLELAPPRPASEGGAGGQAARDLVPGVKVLLQGGLYGTLVEFDGEDLSKPVRVELAPSVEVEVHSQAILRTVEDEPVTEDDFIEAEADQAEYTADVADGEIRSITEDRAAATSDTEPGDAPKA